MMLVMLESGLSLQNMRIRGARHLSSVELKDYNT